MNKPLKLSAMHIAIAGACAWAAAANAQTAPAASAATPAPMSESAEPAAAPVLQKENVVTVSGSRIASRGFTQPTPTTTLSAADLEKNAKPNIFNTLIELPALQGSTGRTTSTGSTSSGIQGLSSLSLRGLQPIRTLTLLDGQRVVGANVTGVTDVSQFPQLLIKRVDVVTGGASASYGSDAVGGVVNFITDKRFKGVKGTVEGGRTRYGDDENGTVQVALGRSFLDDTLHVVASAEYTREKGVPNPGFGGVAANGRTWYSNPAYQVRPLSATTDGRPQITYIDNAQQNQYSKYGLITGGPLRGTAFGDGGVPYQFEYGSNCVGAICQGGDLSGNVGAGTSLGMDLSRKVAYARAGLQLNADHEIYVSGNWSEVGSTFSPNPGAAKQASLTVQCDNAFLHPSIKAACAANNISSFQYGVANAIFPKFIEVNPTRTLKRLVTGAEGRFQLFGKEWGYNGYLEHGENEIEIIVNNMSLNNRYNAAIDAIRLADGSVVCRDVAARNSGCRPLNVYGNNPVDQAALDYVLPPSGPRQYSKQQQQVASFNITGDPFNSWAGPIAVATGAEWRKEQYYVKGDPYGDGVSAENPNTATYPADPVLNNPVGNHWYAGNYHNASGAYTVKEAYLELNVPLLKSSTWGDMNLNIADRQTDYSTSGTVESWKIGATWKLGKDSGLDGWTIRAVTSQDVRAPNLSELYAAQQVFNSTVNYNGSAVQIQQRNIGNVNLRPEIARNTVIGLVLNQPRWLPGFSASIDYFDVKVDEVISSLGPQQLVDLCVEGNQEICSTLQLTGTPGTNYVTVQAFNLARLRNKGFDIELAYRTQANPLGVPGRFTFRALATHIRSFITESGVPNTIPSDAAGVNMGATPDWKVNASQSWDWDKLNVTLTERWISDGTRGNENIECQTNCPVSTVNRPTIFDNQMKGAFYVDIGASYRWNDNITVFAKIDNAGDRDPVMAAQNNVSFGLNPQLYDTLGRTYRAGLRYEF